MTWRMRIAWWMSKTTNTHSDYIIFTAIPLQQWLHERASLLRYYVRCLVSLLYRFISGNNSRICKN